MQRDNRGRKRTRCHSDTEAKLRSAVENGLAMPALSRILSTPWQAPDTIRKKGYELSSELSSCMTKYGQLIQTITIPLEDGSCYEGPYINPMALMYHATESCAKYGCFLQQCFNGRIGKLCFHVDAADLGSMISPDQGREFQSLSYTFAQFPNWYRVRETGYIPFCFLPAKMIDGKNMS